MLSHQKLFTKRHVNSRATRLPRRGEGLSAAPIRRALREGVRTFLRKAVAKDSDSQEFLINKVPVKCYNQSIDNLFGLIVQW